MGSRGVVLIVAAVLAAIPATAAADALPGTWQSVGATVNGTPVSDSPLLVGRVSAVAIVPGSPATEIVGTLGGIWKRTGTGAWTDVTSSSWPATDVNSIAIDPRNHKVMYAGTGWDAADYPDVQPGAGILKSTDGGSVWSPLTSTELPMRGYAVTGLAVDPKNDQIVVAAANNGVFRTINAGRTWTRVLAITQSGSAAAVHLAVDAATGQMLVGVAGSAGIQAHSGSGTITTGHAIYVSSNAGQTWTPYAVDAGTGGGAVIVPAIATTTGTTPKTYAYALDITGDSSSGIYTSSNAQQWTFRTAQNVVQKFTIGQLVVNSHYPTVVYFAEEGGPYRYSYGGTSSAALTSSNGTFCSFGDFRALAFGPSLAQPTDNSVYGGEDGGTCYFDLTKASYTNNGAGLVSTMDYDVSAASATSWLAGSQDLGVDAYSSASTSREIFHADGYGVLIQGGSPSTFFAAVNPPGGPTSFQVSADSGAHWSQVSLSPPPSDVFSPTLRIVQATGDPSVIILPTPGDGIYVSADGGTTWNNRAIALNGDYLTSVKAAVFPGSSTPVIYAGTGFGHVWTSRDLGQTWTEVPQTFSPLSVRDIALDPAHSTVSNQHLYIGVGVYSEVAYNSYPTDGGVLETTDGGASWTDIGQAFKKQGVNALLLSGSTLLAGTDYGVEKYTSGSWSAAGTGFPNVRVNDLELSADGNTFLAATYGRGIYAAPAAP